MIIQIAAMDLNAAQDVAWLIIALISHSVRHPVSQLANIRHVSRFQIAVQHVARLGSVWKRKIVQDTIL